MGESDNHKSEKKLNLARFLPLVGVIMFALAIWALRREFASFNFSDFRNHLSNLSRTQILLAVLTTMTGYLALIGYDWFSLHYVKQKLAIWQVSLAAFVGYAFSMNIGQAIVSGGAVRMRLYTGWGLGAGDVTRMIGFNIGIGMLGQMLVGGLAFTLFGSAIPGSAFHYLPLLGGLFLILVIGGLVLLKVKHAPVQIKSWRFSLPTPLLGFQATLVSGLDWALSGVVLYLLFPSHLGIGFGPFLAMVMLAHITSVLSMIPGGLGVFETVIITLLPESFPKNEALSALIAFRVIYYFIPFLIAILLLGGHEIVARKGHLAKASSKVTGLVLPLVPYLISIAVFMAGTILLLSGATPTMSSRLAALERWIPLVVVEMSHFLGSMVGIGLILLSGALRRRVDAAYFATLILLAAGILASLFKGFDYEEAGMLTLVFFALLPCRHRFHRQAALFAYRFTKRWWLGLLLVMGTIGWIGFTAYAKVHYHQDLWLRFGFHGDASRFLRAGVGVLLILAVFAVWQFLRPGLGSLPPIGDGDAIEKILPMVRASSNTDAYLALMGDKRFLFSPSGQSAIMFGIQGRTWVAMGDPLGDPEEHEDLIWAFMELADAAGARPAFYQVGTDSAHLYAGLGFLLYKLGEEAQVDLTTFTLEGAARKGLRHTKSKLEREDASFEMVASDQFDQIVADLKSISDAWLQEKNAGEKRFSLGNFNPDYLRHFDFAIVRKGEQIVAFANVLKSGDGQELSIDLMRQNADAPGGAMEYLFLELMLWGKAQGYHWFNLGMAPLSGLENRTLAPIWNRIGAQLFTLGEHFYNFKGLRQYKEKFDPTWHPRYLACRRAFYLPTILLDVATLIGGGLLKSITGEPKKKTSTAPVANS